MPILIESVSQYDYYEFTFDLADSPNSPGTAGQEVVIVASGNLAALADNVDEDETIATFASGLAEMVKAMRDHDVAALASVTFNTSSTRAVEAPE